MYPEIVPSVCAYNVQRCYVDTAAARVLDGYMFADTTGMTVQECVSACRGRGCEFLSSFLSKSHPRVMNESMLEILADIGTRFSSRR